VAFSLSLLFMAADDQAMLSIVLSQESIAEQSRANKSNREKARVLVMNEALAMVDEEAWKQLRLASIECQHRRRWRGMWLRARSMTIS
jgi:hypothetical protein